MTALRCLRCTSSALAGHGVPLSQRQSSSLLLYFLQHSCNWQNIAYALQVRRNPPAALPLSQKAVLQSRVRVAFCTLRTTQHGGM